MTYIASSKVFAHLDRMAGWQAGEKPAPVTVEFDLSNRCVLGCQSCFPAGTLVESRSLGLVAIERVAVGDRVLAFNEGSGRLEWADVLGIHERPYVGSVYEVRAGDVFISATSEHPFFTQRGWVKASELRYTDEILHDDLRLWMRSGDSSGSESPSRSLHARNAETDQRVEDSQQPDETSGGRGEVFGRETWQKEHGTICYSAKDVRGRHAEIASDDRRVAEASIGENARKQSDETRGRKGQGIRDQAQSSGGWKTAARSDERSRSGVYIGEDEALESNERSCNQGEEPIDYARRLEPVEVGAVVRTGVHGSSGLVYGHGEVLGLRSESGFQGPRLESGHRSDGRLLDSDRTTNYSQLLGADDLALSIVGRLMPGRDASVQGSEAGDDSGGSQGSGSRVRPDVSERNLEFRRIDCLSDEPAIGLVYNLETSLGTYVAAGVVVHNCHFAHTHTRGPWVMRDRLLPMAFDDVGDMAPTSMVMRALDQMAEAGVKGIVWSGGGEPTTHPNWLEIVEYAASLGLQQGMYTLGGLLRPDWATRLAKVATWVVVSLDCADAITYHHEKGVPLERFGNACDGIRFIAEAGSTTVGVSFLLHAGNWHRAEDMLALSRRLGATYTTFRPTIETSPANPSQCSGDRSWVSDAAIMLERLSRTPGVECDAERFFEYAEWTGRSYSTCYGIRFNATITPDGRVWICPQRRGIPDSLLGDLRTESFGEIWARHPGQRTDLSDCRVMCRLHLMNEHLNSVYQPREHEAFV